METIADAFICFLITIVIFLFGAAFGFSNAVEDSVYNQYINMAIADCEKNLPRNIECEVVITAKPKKE